MRIPGTFLVIIASLLLLSSCNNSEKIKISGHYNGDKGEYIYINRIDVNTTVFIDSVKINKSGDFKLSLRNDLPDFYTLGFDNNDYITIIAYPGDNINLTFEGSSLQENYSVSGSTESEDVRQMDIKLSKTLFTLDSLRLLYEAIPDNTQSIERRKELEEAYTSVVNSQRLYNISYIIENLRSFASIKALFQRLDDNAYVLYKRTDAQYLKLVSDTLNAYYPTSKQAVSLAQNLENELNALNAQRLTAIADGVETVDLNIELDDIDGKTASLYSFNNNSYVLLTFWSALSDECIENNLELMSAYKKYKSLGLEIYQVNIDTDENAWRQAVKYDNLPWINVREENPENPVNAIKYNINSVPSNYLISKDREIVGKDLFGKALQIKLSQLFD